MRKQNLFLLSSGLALWVLAACTKELPYKQTFKDEVIDRSLVDDKAVHLMSSSILNVSRSSQDALPFSSADNKRVKLEWTKNSLRVVELEKDARFRSNDVNNKLVLEIPVTYVDYQCSKDAYGECTNAEEEKADVPWNQKTKFKINPEASKSASLELLPILISKTVGENCYEEVTSLVRDVKVEPTAINIQIERTFKTNIDCLNSLESVSDATVSAVFHYSIAKVSAVATNDFRPVSYPDEDQNTFGFFTTEKTVLDADNNASEGSRKVLMNHWNPNRNEIVYYLSDEFAKPENRIVKDLTYKTVSALNEGLRKSGAKFQINLKEPAGKNPGDIRNSMIVLVEDPVASSVIGYGPQTEDPATGEIISARTVMFLGTIKKFIGYTYDDILREKKRAALEAKKAKEGRKEEAVTAGPEVAQRVASLKAAQSQLLASAGSESNSRFNGSASVLSPKDLIKVQRELHTPTRLKNDAYSGSPKAQFKYLMEAKNCAYGLNADIIGTRISPRLAARFPDDSKPWSQLSDSEKENVMNVILPEIWVPTLIHEMGHNLGLRHNFKGSEDKDNFYTEVELQALGIDHEIPFSSIMEYGDDLKALPVVGKYDIAALRYAYAQKVELKDGSLVDIVGSLAEMRAANQKEIEEAAKASDGKEPAKELKPLEFKAFGYCTDENTGINPGCRRFDLGTTFTEIVQNEIQAYLDGYEARNFRNGRASFSLLDDPAYAARQYDRFLGMRLMQETYESIKHRFGLPDDSPWWNDDKVPFLRDVKQASVLAGQFLKQVLETADVTCLIAKKDEPQKIVQIDPLATLDPESLSCWQAGTRDEDLVVVGQYGKSFRSKKDLNSNNPNADQIDVRGYWIDKLIASRVLFARQLRSSVLDRNTDNFMDKAELREALQATVHGILLNQLAAPQEVTFINGEKAVMELPVDTGASHVLDQPLFSGLAKAFNVPNQEASFGLILARESSNAMISAGHELDGAKYVETLQVRRKHRSESGTIPSGAKTLQIGEDTWFASPSNKVAFEAIKSTRTAQIYEQVPRKRLIDVYKAKKAKQGFETLPDVQAEEKKALKAIWDQDLNTLEDFLTGALGSSQFYQKLLLGLPN